MLSFNEELDADLSEIIADHPSKVTFVFDGQSYVGAKSYTKEDGSTMLPQGYDPDADFQLVVRLATLGGASPDVRDFITIAGEEFKVISVSRNPVFLAMNCKQIA
jgi:hypothetical protein